MTEQRKRVVVAVPDNFKTQTPEERAAFVKVVARNMREGLKPGDKPKEAQ